MDAPAAAAGLDALTRQVRRDLELLDYPRRPWVTARRTASGDSIYDVVIVGAGQSGLATAFGLSRERVGNVLVVDQNPLDRAGPWLNFARMRTLRTPKYLTGGASISGLKYSVARLVSGITRSFFVEDANAHFESLRSFAEEEF